jgi:hypothetical protein
VSSASEVALAEILESAGLSAAHSAAVRFSGDDPVFPTRYRVGADGAASIAATGIAAAMIWQMRTGREQKVEGRRSCCRRRPSGRAIYMVKWGTPA